MNLRRAVVVGASPPCPICGAAVHDLLGLVTHLSFQHGVIELSRSNYRWRCGHAASSMKLMADHLLEQQDLVLHFAESRIRS